VTRVTPYMTIHTSVTKLAPYVLLHQSQSMHCDTCNRSFLSDTCYANHLTMKVKGKLVCAWKQVCRNCSFF
jgi:hypothetical protein